MTTAEITSESKHAVITGGGSGIGLACAQAFIEQGHTVTLIGRTLERLNDAQASLGDHARVAVADITNETSIGDAIAEANEHQPLSIVVANAGMGSGGQLINTPVEHWEKVLQTNLTGAFLTIKHAATAMADRGGAICAISSIAGLRTHRYMSAYCTSKAGLDMLVRNAADELGAAGIRVNSVCPGLVETDLSATFHQHDAMRADYLECMPIERTGLPNDIAAAVAFLCSDQAGWITGVNLPVDGGHHLRRGPNLDRLMA